MIVVVIVKWLSSAPWR